MENQRTDGHPTPMSNAERDGAALQVVNHFSLWSGGAGLIPIPLLDVAAIAAVQLEMLRRLSKIYGVPFSDNMGKSIIASLVGSLIPASAATNTAMSVGSLVKSLPGIGTAIGAVAMPAFSVSATYIIGRVFIQHFAWGGTLLDLSPPDYSEFIKAQKDRCSFLTAKSPDTKPSNSTQNPSRQGTAASRK